MFMAKDATACCCFLGVWLLVAGPMFQGALELRAEQFDRESYNQIVSSLPARQRVSTWWWLCPPVLYWLNQRNTSRHRQKMFAAMTSEQREKLVRFVNKAIGWYMVSGGGALIACKETWDLVERYGLPMWSFFVIIVAMLAICMAYTAIRMVSTDRIVGPASVRPIRQPESSS